MKNNWENNLYKFIIFIFDYVWIFSRDINTFLLMNIKFDPYNYSKIRIITSEIYLSSYLHVLTSSKFNLAKHLLKYEKISDMVKYSIRNKRGLYLLLHSECYQYKFFHTILCKVLMYTNIISNLSDYLRPLNRTL